MAAIALRLLCGVAGVMIVPKEDMATMQSTFSRFGAQGLTGEIASSDLRDLLTLAAREMAGGSTDEARTYAATLHAQLAPQLGSGPHSLAQIINALTDIASTRDHESAVPLTDASDEIGSKQLVALRRRLEANRLTMPMFDTKGWVRDFEKSLKIQWEIYANGLKPMHVVVGRSDHIYGASQFDRHIPGVVMG